MTSNQIAYWNKEETKRTNLAKEAETKRHNVETEAHDLRQDEIAQIRNALQQKGLELQRAEDIIRLNEIYAKYGMIDAQKLPQGVQDEMRSILGLTEEQWKYHDEDVGSAIWETLQQIGKGWSTVVGSKGLGGLF